MKIKSVLAAFAAAAVLSSTAVTAFAETEDDDNKDTLAVTGANATMVETVADTATVDGEKSSDKTGAEGVAAVLGVVALAGAAVVMSRKKA